VFLKQCVLFEIFKYLTLNFGVLLKKINLNLNFGFPNTMNLDIIFGFSKIMNSNLKYCSNVLNFPNPSLNLFKI